MADIFGFRPEEAHRTHRIADLTDRIHPEDRDRVLFASRTAFVAGGTCVLRYRTLSEVGGMRDVLCNGWYVEDGREGAGGRGIVVDLSKRQAAGDGHNLSEPLDHFVRHTLAAWAALPHLETSDRAALEPGLRTLLMLIGRRTAVHVEQSRRLLS